MVIKQKWTSEQINSVSTLYTQGFREKEIARNLDRSVDSIRKKIDHLELRGCKEARKIARLEREKEPLIQIQLNLHQKKGEHQGEIEGDRGEHPVYPHHELYKDPDDKKYNKFCRREIINTMLYQLNQHGHCAKKYDLSSVRKNWSRSFCKGGKPLYIVDGSYLLTDGQLLLRYNRMRYEQKEDILIAPYLVEDC